MTKEEILSFLQSCDLSQMVTFNNKMESLDANYRVYALSTTPTGSAYDAADAATAFTNESTVNKSWIITNLTLRGIGGKHPC